MIKKITLFVMLAFVSFIVHAKDFVIVGSLIEPPWKYYEYNEDLEMEILTGIDIDLFREIQRRTNLKFEFKKLDYSRALLELENNNVDVIPGVTKTLSTKKALKVSSWPYIEKLTSNVYHSSRKSLKIKRYQDIYPYSIGLIRSLGYDNRLDDDPLMIKEYSEDGTDIFKKLIDGKIDGIITTDWEAAYFSQQLKLVGDVQIVADYALPEKVERYLAYSNKLPQYIQRKIEEALDQMIEDGAFDRILDKYFQKIHPKVLPQDENADSSAGEEKSAGAADKKETVNRDDAGTKPAGDKADKKNTAAKNTKSGKNTMNAKSRKGGKK